MSCNITLDRRPKKFLEKLAMAALKEYLRISIFLESELPNCENPCLLRNAKYLQGFSDNRYRWKIGEYRIIGIVKAQEIFFIQVIKIAKRSDKTYKRL